MESFLDAVWGDEPCKVQIARMKEGDSDTFKRVVAEWPAQREVIFESIRENAAQGFDVFFGPALLRRDATDGSKESVSGSRVLWADFDGGAPANWAEYSAKQGLPAPSAVVRSSIADRQHVYWTLEEPIIGDVNLIEDLNRSIAAYAGADKSGWDANQLLRVPGTTNFGWRKRGEHKDWFTGPVEVTVLAPFRSRTYNVLDFKSVPSIQQDDIGDVAHGDIIPASVILAEYPLHGYALEIFTRTAEQAKTGSTEGRSGSLTALIYNLIESGYSTDQIFSLAYDAAKRWGKYFDTRNENQARRQIAKDIAYCQSRTAPLDTTEKFVEKMLTEAGPAESTELKIWDFDEFMAEDFKFDWLINDMLIKGGFGLFTGQPNVGKTTQALHLGMSLASGVDYIDYKIEKPGKVYLLSLEMPTAGIQYFLKDLASPYDKRLLKDNFKMTVPGQMIDLTERAAQKWFEATVSKIEPDLILVDSLRYLMRSLNDEEQVRNVLEYIQKMRTKYGFSMVAVHHDRKKQAGNVTGETSDLYGSQHIGADVDYALSWYSEPADPMKGKPIAMYYRQEIKNRYALKRETLPVIFNGHDRRVNIGDGKFNQEGTGDSADAGGVSNARKPDDPPTLTSGEGISF